MDFIRSDSRMSRKSVAITAYVVHCFAITIWIIHNLALHLLQCAVLFSLKTELSIDCECLDPARKVAVPGM